LLSECQVGDLAVVFGNQDVAAGDVAASSLEELLGEN